MKTPDVEKMAEKAAAKPRRFTLPPYWAKRKKRLQPKFLEEVEESFNSSPIASDSYGEYRVGTFLHDACVVSVKRDNGLWFLHIISQEFVSLLQIKNIRYKYLPNDAIMAMPFPTREEDAELQGILLYEIPKDQIQDEETTENQDKA